VSDTSPLTALLTTNRAEILSRLFGEVVIPEAVRRELLRTHTLLPPWLRVEPVKNLTEAARLARSVDDGEAEAIELARELRADWLLIDERKGRRLAVREGVRVIGLFGVVLSAKRRGIIPSARALLDQLQQQAGMYISEEIKRTGLPSGLVIFTNDVHSLPMPDASESAQFFRLLRK
jgi:uncharacterized protein